MTALHLVEPVEFTGEIHAYADRWPMSTAEEIDTLAASIAANGQRFPIVLDPDGRLIDGRNRLAACTLVGIAPTFVVDDSLTSEDAIGAYIWDVNGERRDMSKGQKAMLAALRPGTKRSLSDQTGVANGYIAKARQVIQWCDERTIVAVCAGALALNDAYEQAQRIKATEQAEEIAAKRAAAEAKAKAEESARRLVDLRQARPDLASLVEAGKLPLADALTVRDRDLAAQRRAEANERERIRKFNADIGFALSVLAPLSLYQDRIAQVATDLDPRLFPVEVPRSDLVAARASIDLIIATIDESDAS